VFYSFLYELHFKYIKITTEEHRLIRASVYSKRLPVEIKCLQFMGVFLLVYFAFAYTNCVWTLWSVHWIWYCNSLYSLPHHIHHSLVAWYFFWEKFLQI